MKRALFIFLMLMLFMACPCALAQQVVMEDSGAAMEFPDPWLVLSPATVRVYASVLSDAGMDAEAMAARYAQDGVVCEAWSEDFTQCLRLTLTTDERSQRIHDIERATDGERSTIKNLFENNRYEGQKSNVRYQSASWVTHSTMGRFLLTRYNVKENDEITARGLQYFTIRNGVNYVIDWSVTGRRLTNADLTWFRQGILENFIFTVQIDPPPLPVTLEASLPSETGNAALRLEGRTSANAGLSLTYMDGESAEEVLSVGSANSDGTFTLNFELPQAGVYTITLTAEKEGYTPASISGQLTYEPKLLPVNFTELPEGEVTGDMTPLSGVTVAGATLQLLTDKGVTTKRAGSTGTFSFELTTKEAGEYSYTLAVDKTGYDQRRIPVHFTRVITDQQQMQKIKDSAQRISYANLQKKSGQYLGTVMRLSGQVAEVTEGQGSWFIRLNIVKSAKGTWGSPVLISCGENPGIETGSNIVIYASVAEPFIEQDAEGADVTVPGFTFILWEQN